MTQHDDLVRLKHIRDQALEAIGLIKGKSRSDLEKDHVLQLALTRLVEIIGEASVQVSAEFKQRHKEIPWQQMEGMRNRLIHEYDNVDLNILWNAVKYNLPDLLDKVKSVLD
jgi:uncharacterized protein with HEPN domain